MRNSARMTTTTAAAKWTARVQAWRQSGLTARVFCQDKDFSDGGLRYWGSRIRRGEAAGAKPELRLSRIVGGTMGDSVETPIWVEACGVRVEVRRGFDREVLRAVLEVLTEHEVSR